MANVCHPQAPMISSLSDIFRGHDAQFRQDPKIHVVKQVIQHGSTVGSTSTS